MFDIEWCGCKSVSVVSITCDESFWFYVLFFVAAIAVLLRTRKIIGVQIRCSFSRMWKNWIGWGLRYGYHTKWTTKTWVKGGKGEPCWSKRWLRFSGSLISSTACGLLTSMSAPCLALLWPLTAFLEIEWRLPAKWQYDLNTNQTIVFIVLRSPPRLLRVLAYKCWTI